MSVSLHAVAGRLSRFPADRGIPSVDSVVGDVVPAESAQVPPGSLHNLAPLVDALNLREQIAAAALELADRSFTWLVGRLAIDAGNRHARLQAVKNAAYAWHQAIYFLSLCDHSTQAEALTQLRGHLQAASEDLQGRFGSAVDGLAHVIEGGRSTTQAEHLMS